jgi:hypothetical protein
MAVCIGDIGGGDGAGGSPKLLYRLARA